MAIKKSRGVTSGRGEPIRSQGQDGDITIRRTSKGRKLFVKDIGNWYGFPSENIVSPLLNQLREINLKLKTIENRLPKNKKTFRGINIKVPGTTTTEDPKIVFQVGSSDKWAIGVDDDDATDPLVFGVGKTLGSADKFKVDKNGKLYIVDPASKLTSSASHKVLIPNSSTGEISYRTAAEVVSDGGGFVKDNAADIMAVSDFGANAALKIDADQPATAGAEDSKGLWIDYDRIVAGSGTAAHNDIGIDLDVNSASLGTSTVKGMDVDVVGATTGTYTATGIDLDVDGADTNIGININTAGTHIKLEPNADADDFATISVADTGDLTIATNDDAAVAGDIVLDADGNIELNADGGDITFKDDSTTLASIDSSGNLETTGNVVANTGIAVKNGSSTGGYVNFFEDSDHGTNFATLRAPSNILGANYILTLPEPGSGANGTLTTLEGKHATGILGTTRIANNSTTSGHSDIALTSGYTVLQTAQSTDVKVKFVIPVSGAVKIDFSCHLYGSSTVVEFALSSAASYAEVNEIHTYDYGTIQHDEIEATMAHVSWIVTGLTAGNEQTYYIAADEVSGTAIIRHGRFRATGTHHPPIIVTATAIPDTSGDYYHSGE